MSRNQNPRQFESADDESVTTLLFSPVEGEDLRDTFPELRDYEEFADLGYEELLFANEYGNPTRANSRIANPIEKAEKCFQAAFVKNSDEDLRSRYVNEQFPAEVLRAVKKFQSFDPGIRRRTLKIHEKIFGNYEELMEQLSLMKKKKSGEQELQSAGALKDIVDIMVKIDGALPAVMKHIESGTGITAQKRKRTPKEQGYSFENALKTSAVADPNAEIK